MGFNVGLDLKPKPCMRNRRRLWTMYCLRETHQQECSFESEGCLECCWKATSLVCPVTSIHMSPHRSHNFVSRRYTRFYKKLCWHWRNLLALRLPYTLTVTGANFDWPQFKIDISIRRTPKSVLACRQDASSRLKDNLTVVTSSRYGRTILLQQELPPCHNQQSWCCFQVPRSRMCYGMTRTLA